MPKALCILLILAMLVSLTGCGALYLSALVIMGDDRADKSEIFAFVRENEAELLQAIQTRDFSAFENQGFIGTIRANDESIEFSCGGVGMGSSTSYVGFYYTSTDDMTAVWCAPKSADDLVVCGDGYEWKQPDGDNRYYTEHISGNFYYYEASF